MQDDMQDTCTICKKSKTHILRPVRDAVTGALFEVQYCPTCELGQTKPIPSDLAPYYPERYYGNRHGKTATWCLNRRLRWLPLGKTLLDVGCGDGSFLCQAEKRNWTVVGLERFPELARAKGVTVYETVHDLNGQYFDCITAWHSLEHFQDPNALIVELARHLHSTGQLILAVPNAGGWQAYLFGAYWLHLDVPRHLWHFTLGSLRTLLEDAGLEIVESKHCEVEYDLLGWSQSLLNFIFPASPNDYFYWLTQKPMRSKGTAKWAQIVVGLFFTGVALPLVLISQIFRRGGTLIIFAQHKQPFSNSLKKVY